MTKQELAQFLSTRTGMAATICDAMLTEAFAGIGDQLARGETVELDKFGAFRVEKPEGSESASGRFVGCNNDGTSSTQPSCRDDSIDIEDKVLYREFGDSGAH